MNGIPEQDLENAMKIASGPRCASHLCMRAFYCSNFVHHAMLCFNMKRKVCAWRILWASVPCKYRFESHPNEMMRWKSKQKCQLKDVMRFEFFLAGCARFAFMDNIRMRSWSCPDALFVTLRIIWMDDVGCSNWNCAEPSEAWHRAKRQGLVQEARLTHPSPARYIRMPRLWRGHQSVMCVPCIMSTCTSWLVHVCNMHVSGCNNLCFFSDQG